LSWMIYGLMAVISVIVIVVGVKKCKDKKDWSYYLRSYIEIILNYC
jgi:hypothetical protein